MKILIWDTLPIPKITSSFWFWKDYSTNVWKNGNTCLLNEWKVGIRSLPKQDRIIKPIYQEFFWISETSKYCAGVNDINSIDILEFDTWKFIRRLNIPQVANEPLNNIRDVQLFWKYLFLSIEDDSKPVIKIPGNEVWNHTIKRIDIETMEEKIIEDPECVLYNLSESDGFYFTYLDWWNYSWKYLHDKDLNIIRIPESYYFPSANINDGMLILKKQWDTDNYVRNVWSSDSPIGPYEWIGKFSEWKCLVYNCIFSIIDKKGDFLFSTHNYDFSSITTKRLLNINNQNYWCDESNIFKDWKIILWWDVYDDKSKILFSFEWSKTEKQELKINSKNNWLYVGLRKKNWKIEQCIFNEKWTLLVGWVRLCSDNKIVMKVDWAILILSSDDKNKCRVHPDNTYVVDVLFDNGFTKNKSTVASIESLWKITKYLITDKNFNKENLWSLKQMKKLSIEFNDISDELIQIKWKNFKKKLLKL